MSERRQIRVCFVSQAFAYALVHGWRPIEVRRRIHPDDIEVSGLLGACPDRQRILKGPGVHLVVQRGLFARSREMIELPGLIGAVFDHVRAEGHFQPLGHRRRRNVVITPGSEVLARVPGAADGPLEVSRLRGGLTNRSFLVGTVRGRYVVRLGAGADALLAIDRRTEAAAQRLAAGKTWLAEAQDEHWFIQLRAMDADQTEQIEAFLQRLETLLPPEQTRAYLGKRGNTPRLGVIFGEYENHAAAERALASLPAELRNSQPYLRQVRKLR